MSTNLPPTISDATVTLSYAGFIPGVAANQYFGYCTVAGLRYEFPNLDSYSDLFPSPAGNSILAEEITTTAIQLQDMLDHYYQMPYTGAASVILVTLFKLNAKLAVAKLLDHYAAGEFENASGVSAMLQAEAGAIVQDIREGVIRWDPPFGDATPRPMLPIYDTAQAVSISGSTPWAADPASATPIFSIGKSPFRPNQY